MADDEGRAARYGDFHVDPHLSSAAVMPMRNLDSDAAVDDPIVELLQPGDALADVMVDGS
jgi:hypothetical protein